MGWGLTIKNVYLARVTKNELPDVAQDAEESIRSAKERLLILAAATPRVMDCGNGSKIDWNDHIQKEITNIMQDVEEQVVRLHLAKVAMQNLEDVEEG